MVRVCAKKVLTASLILITENDSSLGFARTSDSLSYVGKNQGPEFSWFGVQSLIYAAIQLNRFLKAISLRELIVKTLVLAQNITNVRNYF